MFGKRRKSGDLMIGCSDAKKKLTFFENRCEIEGREEQHDPMIMAWHYKSSKSEPFAQEEEQTNSGASEHADLAPLPLPPNTDDGLDENASGEPLRENAEVKCRFKPSKGKEKAKMRKKERTNCLNLNHMRR